MRKLRLIFEPVVRAWNIHENAPPSFAYGARVFGVVFVEVIDCQVRSIRPRA